MYTRTLLNVMIIKAKKKKGTTSLGPNPFVIHIMIPSDIPYEALK